MSTIDTLTASIETLIPDIHALIKSKKEGWFHDQLSGELAKDLASRLSRQLGASEHRATLRLSAMGPRCPRALWYSIHHPELAEALPPWAEIKFAFGHVIEALAITLAKAAGHEVTGEQDELVLDGIKGHRDCIIDGHIVDVKSASSISFSKFKNGEIRNSDSFGYLDQLDGYILASNEDPLVRNKKVGYLFAVDKTLGHMCLYKHEVTDARENTLRERIRYYKEITAAGTPPTCECKVIPQGASGNMQLDFKAGYSAFKHCCHPGLRVFLYSSGPVYLTKVVRRPDVTEVDKTGKVVYN